MEPPSTPRMSVADTLGFLLTDPSDPDDNSDNPTWSPESSHSHYQANTPNMRDATQPASSRPPRPLQQRRTASASQVQALSYGEQVSPPNTFEPPLRSIFASGPPTASVSANTALASLSAATTSSGSGPLAALTSAGGSRRSNLRIVEPTLSTSTVGSSSGPSLLRSEKDVDDPNASVIGSAHEAGGVSTSTTLAHLFVASEGTTPLSRGPSHFRSMSGIARIANDTSTLSGHLLHHGFLGGRHSDITVHAFGESYRLHKLLLDRVPYFSSAFSGGWAESSAEVMTIMPEEIDANITKSAFELALKRIYGTHFPIQEDQEAIGLFATACWLDMPELVDSCVEAILRQMQPSSLHGLIKLVTGNYYGKAGDRILASAKAMLCREGWEMPYEYWDGIPAEIIREIVGGDPFFVPSEWERWFLTVKLLNRRLKASAVEAGLVSVEGRYLYSKPSSIRFFAVRFDTTYRQNSGYAGHRHVAERDDAWLALYTTPEVTPLLVLLDEGIHYVHLRFEQLQQIRYHKDIFGVPILPEKVISDALWMSMELRQRVLNCHEEDLELGLSEEAEQYEDSPVLNTEQTSQNAKGKQRDNADEVASEPDIESGSWDGNARPRKFWIPSNDVSCVLGGTKEAYAAANSTNSTDWTTQAARLSASLEPADVAWASDFVLENGRPPSRNLTAFGPPRYSHFPPFRFSAEFPNPRTLKEKKRVYSQTVWYAGSMWNLYIQRVHTAKNQQLGIYLHRAKDKDPSDDPLAQFIPATVDDRIGQLEREMLLRKSGRRNRQWRVDALASGGDGEREEESTNASVAFDDSNQTSQRAYKTGQAPTETQLSPRPRSSTGTQLLESEEEDEELLRLNQRLNVPAMPPYLDTRPVIKTYFKIYSPDKAGRLLSIYESAPEKFVVSKSWGWKSSQMVLDEGINGYDVARSAKETKLRYMVTIGNV